MVPDVLPNTASSPFLKISCFSLSKEQRRLFQLVGQVVLRILFPLISTLFMAAILPVTFKAALLTMSALSFSFLALFFFQPEISHSTSFKAAGLLPLSSPPEAIEPIALPGREPLPVCGISNHGNNCWLNASLQLLHKILSIKEFLANQEPEWLRYLYQFFINYEDAVQKGFSKMPEGENCINSQHIRQLLAEGPAEGLIDSSAMRQEDASEGVILHVLNALPGRVITRQTCTYKMPEGLPFIASVQGDNRTLFIDKGKRTAEVTSQDEEKIPLFSIPILKNLDFAQMVNAHFTEEFSDVSNEVAFLGEDGKRYRYPKLKQKEQLCTTPPYLFFHLKRFERRIEENRAVSVKIQDDVLLPLEIDLHLVDGSKQQYQLVGTVNHRGATMRSGHYIAYVREKDGRWYECNDRSVTPIDQPSLEQAYLCLYLPVPPELLGGAVA